MFADPSGPAESALSRRDGNDTPTYRVELSIEKGVVVHQKFRLRAFPRQFASDLPENYYWFIREGGAKPDGVMLFPIRPVAAREQDLRRVA